MHEFEKEGSPADALRKATDDLATARRTGSKRAEVQALIQIAEARLDKDGSAAALNAVNDAMVCKKLGYEDLVAKSLQVAAQAWIAQGSAKDALQSAAEMLDVAEKLGDTMEVAAAHRTLARAQSLANSTENALTEVNKALAIYREKGNLKEQAATLLVASEVHAAGGQQQEAERAAKYALRLFRDAAEGRGAAAALLVLVQLYIVTGQFQEARKVAEEELALTQRLGDKKGEAGALRAPVLAYLASDNFEAALAAAEEGMKRLVVLGDRRAEAHMMLALADVYAGMGRGEDSIYTVLQAKGLFQKLGDREGEKAALQLLGQVHEAKGMDPPSSAYRTESLFLLPELSTAVQARDEEAFDSVVARLSKIGSFLTKKDVLNAVGSLDEPGLLEFFQARAPSEVKDRVLQAAARAQEEAAVGSGREVRAKEADKLLMYGTLRIGALVYGPRFRQIEAFFPVSGYLLVHSIVRPSSLCDDWELEGWDWNPAVIDAGAHASFALSQVPI